MTVNGRLVLPIFFLWTGAIAQSNEWPVLFTVPARPDSMVDSARIKVASDTKVFEDYQKTSNSLEWKPKLQSFRLQQRCLFETSGDVSFDALNQFYDFSGSLMKDSVLPKSGTLGLEWTPTSYLNLRKSGGGFQTTSDLGPVMQWRPHDVPFRVRGGLSGTGWNDSLPGRLIDSRIADFHGDAGFYGAFVIGNPASRFLGKPLYLNIQGFGRSIRQAGIAGLTGSALFAGAARSGDSLFAYYGDSLSDGKENYWGSGTAGRAHYMSTPWRIARAMQAAGGVKTRARLGLQPSLIYSYTENSVRYPSGEAALNDVRVRLQSLNLQMHTRENLPMVYKGGIKFSWGAEEWLFGKDLNDITSSETGILETKRIGDHQKYIAASDHSLGISLPKGFNAEYKLSLFRDSKTYNFSYTDAGIEKRNYDDNDRITVNHHLGIQRQQFHGFDAELFGEYSTYIINYVHKERSAGNATENGYRVGLHCRYQPLERLMLDEKVSADAEITDYLYSEVHRGDSLLNGFDPPPSQRRFSSLFTGQWEIGRSWVLDGRWIESYYDKGKWYGREYLAVDTLRSDYYAIETKTVEYTVELALSWVRQSMRVKSGCLFRDNYDRSFNDRDRQYEPVSNGQGYFLEPFAETQLLFRHFTLKGRIARMVNTLAPDRGQLSKNWDIHLVGSALW